MLKKPLLTIIILSTCLLLGTSPLQAFDLYEATDSSSAQAKGPNENTNAQENNPDLNNNVRAKRIEARKEAFKEHIAAKFKQHKEERQKRKELREQRRRERKANHKNKTVKPDPSAIQHVPTTSSELVQ